MPIDNVFTEQHVMGVNDIIADSFGEGFRGDLFLYTNPIGWDVRALSSVLSGIGALKGNLSYILSRSRYPVICAGRFGSEKRDISSSDGTSLIVREEYFESAQNYARLFQERFGEPVRIAVDNKVEIPMGHNFILPEKGTEREEGILARYGLLFKRSFDYSSRSEPKPLLL
jgi:hypothetical protein